MLTSCKQLLDFHFQIIELFFGVATAHSGVLAGICQNFRAIDGDGHLPNFQDPAVRGMACPQRARFDSSFRKAHRVRIVF